MWRNKKEKDYVYENIYLVDRKAHRKELINKILIFGLLAVVVVVSSVLSGIMVAESSKEKVMGEESKNVTEQDENTANNNSEIEEENNKPVLRVPVFSEESKNRMNNIYVADSDEKIAYLTFDDGPSSNITPQILKILEDEGIKATFFVLGNRVERCPEIVKQEYEAGHYIANHGYSHEYKKVYSSANAVLDEYNQTETIIKNAIGNEEYSSHIFRFPGGSQGGKYAKVKNEAKGLLEQNDICYINWNALTNDAVGKPTAESLVNDLKTTSNGKNRIVVLMHDTGSKQLTVDTLPEVISYLREQGYVFKNFYDIMY